MSRKTASRDDTAAAPAPESTSESGVTQHPPQEMPAAVDAPPPQKLASPKRRRDAPSTEGAVPPGRELPKVPLRTFAATSPIKDDQIAPFLAHALKNRYPNRTLPEWRKAWDEFQSRPVS